jgi:hypothetical protein
LKMIKSNLPVVGMLSALGFVISLFFIPLAEHW